MTSRYSALGVINHWLTLIAVAVMLVLGFAAAGAPSDETKYYLLGVHVALGFFVFFFVMWRVGWRLREGFAKPQTEQAWEARLAALVHRLLLAALVLLVFTGPLYLFTEGEAINVFGWFEVGIPLGALSFLHEPVEVIHVYIGLYGLPILIGLHMLGAFKHYLAQRGANTSDGL